MSVLIAITLTDESLLNNIVSPLTKCNCYNKATKQPNQIIISFRSKNIHCYKIKSYLLDAGIGV